jgi:hypothetical protein
MATYFVATNGNNTNPGTIEQPFLTWQHGFNQLQNPGDTLFIRGGTYLIATGTSIISWPHTKNGTDDNPIVVSTYPPDFAEGNPAILDRSIATSTGGMLYIENMYHWKFFGLIFQNSPMVVEGALAESITIAYSKHVTFEQIVVRNIEGRGIRVNRNDSIYFINCDIHDIANRFSSDGHPPGSRGNGFSIMGPTNSEPESQWLHGLVVIDGCRVWNIANVGYDNLFNSKLHINNSWTLNVQNRAFVSGWVDLPQPDSTFIVTNSVTLYSNRKGLWYDDSTYAYTQGIRWYNNIVVRNRGREPDGTVINGNTAFRLQFGSVQEHPIIVRNNVSYESNSDFLTNQSPKLIADYNSWDIPLALTDADFVGPMDEHSLVSAFLAARKADGSLPDFTNLWPSETSQLRNAGVDVGLPYEGTAPDLGPFQYQTLTSQYTLTRNVTGSGSIVATPNLSLYENENVSLLAVPATGWEFNGWSGDLSGTINPQTLLMDGNKTVNAAFSQIILPPPFDNWSILSYPVLQGSISGNALVSNLNTVYPNNNINLNELKAIVEVLFDIDVFWDNTPIRTINVSMRCAEIRSIINTNTEVLYNNLFQLYTTIKAYTTINIDNLGWIILETKLLLNPSSTQFARTNNWNIDILKRNTTLLYDLLKSYYLD